MLDKLAEQIVNCSRGVVLTGAGISAESGVPTFRGKEGLWRKFRPEQLATMDAFLSSPDIVWEWYKWRRELISKVQPNPGHYALRDLEGHMDDFTLVTQNVDNLHRLAGSEHVLELHGNIYRNKCVECSNQYPQEADIDPADIPKCQKCSGKIRPDVVWFGEMLPSGVLEEAFERSEKAEIFFSIGTSGLVHPAASLPVVAKRSGATLVEINPDRTPLTDLADFYFDTKSGEMLPGLIEELAKKTGEK